MIPLKLSLKNFLSYGENEQTINFEPYHLICLSGKNGHGKSALLDAITWAVWGHARKISGSFKSDEYLVHLGKTHMRVIFDFIFNGEKYRIRREYAKSHGKPYSGLDFGIIDINTQRFKPLTGKTIRSTQKIIEQIIGIDYESFINSAFLRQGNANEFSKKSPKERKEILSSILRLHHLELFKKLTLEKVKEIQMHTEVNQGIHTRIEQELKNREHINNLLINKHTQLKATETAIIKIENQNKILKEKAINLQERIKKKELAEMQLHYILTQEQEKKALLKKLVITWRSIHHQKLKMPCIHDLRCQKNSILQEIHIQNTERSNFLTIKETLFEIKTKYQELQNSINSAHEKNKNHLSVQLNNLEQEYHNTQKEYNSLCAEKIIQQKNFDAAKKEIELLKKKLTTLINILHQKFTFQEQFEKRKRYYYHWQTAAQTVQKELEELINHQKNLNDNINSPSCPLCTQNLSASRKKFLIDKFFLKQSFYQHRITRFKHLLPTLKHALENQYKELATLQLQAEEKKEVEQKIYQYMQQQHNYKNDIELLEERIHILKKQLVDIEAQNKKLSDTYTTLKATHKNACENNTELKKLRSTSIQLEKKIQATQFSEQTFLNHQQILQEIDQKIEEYTTLLVHIQEQEHKKQEIYQLIAELRKNKHEKSTLEHTVIQEERLKSELEEIIKSEKLLQEQQKATLQEKEKTLQEYATLQNQAHKLQELHQEKISLAQKINELSEQQADYQVLAHAFGKDGIQALLIEHTLPEIEHEANELLGLLTHNQSHILIESLRDLKKGGTKETLDINISDSCGIRPYELFSGGEAFRIDFALRVAVSKLLAKRAGTSLQTLIIDEGFGSQDEEGIQLLMDAIYKIQNNFKKIIIISHLPILKNQFPVHFNIEKWTTGSTINIIEQG